MARFDTLYWMLGGTLRFVARSLEWVARKIEPHRPKRIAREEGVEVAERHGAARDERSFEQRRRGGPVTGEVPGKAHGPRHAGGGHKRGRDPLTTEILEEIVELPIDDYDELPADEVVKRLGELDRAGLARILSYERATKGRARIVEAAQRRLAA